MMYVAQGAIDRPMPPCCEGTELGLCWRTIQYFGGLLEVHCTVIVSQFYYSRSTTMTI